jgi:hypothetical protein
LPSFGLVMAMFMTSSRDRVGGDWSCGDRYIPINTPLGGLRPVTNPRGAWMRIDNPLIDCRVGARPLPPIWVEPAKFLWVKRNPT